MRRSVKRRGLCFEGTADEGKAIQASAETTLSNQRRLLFAVTSAATTEGGEAPAVRCGTCCTVAKILQTSAALQRGVNAVTLHRFACIRRNFSFPILVNISEPHNCNCSACHPTPGLSRAAGTTPMAALAVGHVECGPRDALNSVAAAC